MQRVLRQLEERRAAGDDAEVAKGLLAMRYLVLWVRSDNGEPPFQRAVTLAREAVTIYRRLDDRRGLLRALLVSTSPFDQEGNARILAEAEQIAEALGDDVERARTMAARARQLGLTDRERATALQLEALAIFEREGKAREAAQCLFSLSIHGEETLKRGYALRAAELYRSVNDRNQSSKCVTLALMNWPIEEGDLDERIALCHQGLRDAQTLESRTTESGFYRELALCATRMGDVEEAAKFRRWHEELADSDGLTPKERKKQAVEMTKMLIAMAKASGNREAIEMFEAELKRIKQEKA